jgi:hypothetical protein
MKTTITPVPVGTIHFVPFPGQKIKGQVIAGHVVGDCQVPRVIPGDIVVVELGKQTSPGNLVLVGDGVMEYKLENGKAILKSNYGEEPLKNIIQGVVIALIKEV